MVQYTVLRIHFEWYHRMKYEIVLSNVNDILYISVYDIENN